MSRRAHVDSSQLRITTGALALLVLEVGLSLVWLMSERSAQASLAEWLVPTPDSVWRRWRVWTLATGPLVELSFVSLVFQGVVLWMFVPALERFWGTKRFLRFALLTSVAGTACGTVAGLATGRDVAIVGLDPFIYGAIVAFGMLYARRPVQFFGVLPMTGRQLMIGIAGFVILFVLVGRKWEEGAAYFAAMGLAALLLSERWSPVERWRRWRTRRARAHLRVVEREPKKWIN